MTNLTLTILRGAESLAGPTKILNQPKDGDSFTIGRSADCNWVLQDQTVSISREHCRLDFHNDGVTITDLDSTNGTTVCNLVEQASMHHGGSSNHFPLRPNQPATLTETCEILLGKDVCIQIYFENQFFKQSTDPVSPIGLEDVPSYAQRYAAHQAGADAFAAPEAYGKIPEYLDRAYSAPSLEDKPVEIDSLGIPDSPAFDHINPSNNANVSSTPDMALSSDEGGDSGVGPILDMQPERGSAFVEIGPAHLMGGAFDTEILPEQGVSVQNPTGTLNQPAIPQKDPSSIIPPQIAPNESKRNAEPMQAVIASHLPENTPIQRAESPESEQFSQTSPPKNPQLQPPASPHSAQHGQSQQAAQPVPAIDGLAVLFESLQLPPQQIPKDPEARIQLAKLVGENFRALVWGVQHQLELRNEIKGTFDVKKTEYNVKNHNPLKFGVKQNSTANLLSGHPKQMGSVQAIEDAFHSLTSHQYALLHSIQRALAQTIETLSPENFEKELTRNRGTTLFELLNLRHNAADLWKMFTMEHQRLSDGLHQSLTKIFQDAVDETKYNSSEVPSSRPQATANPVAMSNQQMMSPPKVKHLAQSQAVAPRNKPQEPQSEQSIVDRANTRLPNLY